MELEIDREQRGDRHGPHLLDASTRFQEVIRLHAEPLRVLQASKGHPETGRSALHDRLLEKASRSRDGEEEADVFRARRFSCDGDVAWIASEF